MKFEFVSSRDFNFIETLAASMRVKAENNCIRIPENIGNGFIEMIHLEPQFILMMHRFCLKEELIIKRQSSAHPPGL